ncbi:tetratricopeptide repeat-containing sulfotransferase family protein [Microbulbifer sp.]|uniref:tetratricopeptide repeat-containing sulfotransferase family protein n=1 Tax=Microbulbifer sp. TaxID=1908541 RepID=UPI00258813C3|nr:tetratricopeptide repeat-containing sulfotransferase family protein [Microbulbifer sp.]
MSSSPSSPSGPADSNHQASLIEIRGAIKKRDFSGARDQALALLEEQPEDTELLYLLAASQRYLGEHAAAQQTLETLLTVDSENARGHQERGHNAAQLQDTDTALAAYRRATELNPALHASWRGLALTLRAQDDSEAAEHALRQFQHLQKLPPELLSAASLLYERKLHKAEQLCRTFLQKHRHHPEGMRLLAVIGAELGILDDADFLLESCLALYPDFHQARFDYIGVLRKRQKFAVALEQARILTDQLKEQQGARQAEILFATQSAMVGDYDTALATYDRIASEAPELHGVHLQRGHVLKTIGDADAANRAYHDACRAKPDFGDAYWSLANMKTYRFEDAEITRMRELEAAPSTARDDRYHLCFALGKALEDRKNFAEAFQWYEKGNALKQEECRYSIEHNRRDTDLQIAHCTRALLDRYAGAGCDAPDPIFIVGLPRAGSTLLEQILASHSQVDGTLELHNILATARRLDGRRRASEEPRYPALLHELEAEKLVQLGQRYLDETRIHRAGAPLFIDKMPNNFRHIGLIQLMLPNAKIIDARRHPLSCCFSGFKQLFAEGQEFTYGLQQIGEYYRDYVRLMDHWDRVLPGKVLRVHYENVVSDLEGQVRRILDYCGLPFEEACIDFHKTERAVRTPSAEQVRQPIYRSGVEQWKHFEAQLEPLKALLAAEIAGYPAES